MNLSTSNPSLSAQKFHNHFKALLCDLESLHKKSVPPANKPPRTTPMPDTHHDKRQIRLEMSISEQEFHRLINNLPRKPESLHEETAPPASNCRTWRLRLASGDVRITLHPLPAKRLGALTLSRACVRLDMRALPDAERTAFFSRFRRHFQRGGG